jgi:hypothetical protein
MWWTIRIGCAAIATEYAAPDEHARGGRVSRAACGNCRAICNASRDRIVDSWDTNSSAFANT